MRLPSRSPTHTRLNRSTQMQWGTTKRPGSSPGPPHVFKSFPSAENRWIAALPYPSLTNRSPEGPKAAPVGRLKGGAARFIVSSPIKKDQPLSKETSVGTYFPILCRFLQISGSKPLSLGTPGVPISRISSPSLVSSRKTCCATSIHRRVSCGVTQSVWVSLNNPLPKHLIKLPSGSSIITGWSGSLVERKRLSSWSQHPPEYMVNSKQSGKFP